MITVHRTDVPTELHDPSMLVISAYRADVATADEVVTEGKKLGALPQTSQEVVS